MSTPNAPLAGQRIVIANWRDLDHSMAGGAERYAWQFAKALVDAGAKVEFVTAREPGQRRRDRRDGIAIRRGGRRFGFYFFAAWFLLTRNHRIDAVVDCEAGIPVFSPLWLRRSRGRSTPVVLIVHHVHQRQFATYLPVPLALLGRYLEGVAMPRVYRSARTVAVSESTRTEMITQLGWSGPIAVLHNGNPAPLPVEVVAEDTVDRVAVVGRLAPHKRVDLVIRSIAALSERRPAIHLDVIGRGPQTAELEQLAEELGIAKHVTVHGFLEEDHKAAVLARTRLHVCASDVEGWGQVVIEAASYGVPTVARAVPGLRGSVRPGTTGWLIAESGRGHADLHSVQSRLTVAIDDALNELEDPERRAEISADCRDWAAGFSWQRMHTGAVTIVAAATHQHMAQQGAAPQDEREWAK